MVLIIAAMKAHLLHRTANGYHRLTKRQPLSPLGAHFQASRLLIVAGCLCTNYIPVFRASGIERNPAEIQRGEQDSKAMLASIKERNIHVELIFRAELIQSLISGLGYITLCLVIDTSMHTRYRC